MAELHNTLLNAYERGFIDRYTSKTSHHPPELIINSKKENVLSPLLDAMEACNNFIISVAFITEGGIASLKTVLLELQQRGIRGRIVTSTYLHFNKPKVYKELLKIPNVDVRITSLDGFHAKGYIFDHDKHSVMFIGSSNLTDTALKKNYEYNLKLTSLDNGEVIKHFKEQFDELWDGSTPITEQWIHRYEKEYNDSKPDEKVLKVIENNATYQYDGLQKTEITPNLMQQEALDSLKILRKTGETKGLIVSATGTGKTYLSAFDVKAVQPERVLFVAHREQILQKSLKDFQSLLGEDISNFGIYSGSNKQEDVKYTFATVQTLSRTNHLYKFKPDAFDYIIIDEAHRTGSVSYHTIIDYFKPKFMLGMTATPERTDNMEIFGLFDYNIAYEIRLQKAMEEDLLVPFHYFGVTDYEHDGKTISDDSTLYQLTDEDRINHIIDKLNYYSHAGERVRGLMFVSNREEAKELSETLNNRGYKTVALTGMDSQSVREQAVKDLETFKLEYIITVDIFNEGIDIPSINQVVMLRQTESSIVFVQQLGRGLRKYEGKEFLTVIDFIGNYNNNYLIPVALTGDRSFNKDQLRKDVMDRNIISGASTVNFERIAQERIFKSISKNKSDHLANLRKMYTYTKNKLGHRPTLVDLYNDPDSINPLIVLRHKSFNHYHQFLIKMKETDLPSLTTGQDKILTFLSKEFSDGKRVSEIYLIKSIIEGHVQIQEFQRDIYAKNIFMTDETVHSIIRMLTLDFFVEHSRKRYAYPLVRRIGNTIELSSQFKEALQDDFFKTYVQDLLDMAILASESYDQTKQLTTYEKYSRKDVLRLLNWENDESSTVYGYKQKHSTLPIFITYHKNEEHQSIVSYEDKLLDSHVLRWYTRAPRTLVSKEIIDIVEGHRSGVKMHIFIKKDDDEGIEHYYFGEAKIDFDSLEDLKVEGKNGLTDIVRMNLILEQPVEYNLYRYFEN